MDSYPVADKKSQTLMQLAHYFITVENYTPIVVKGAENELWLENLDAPYRIIRLNLNYIHNNEQLKFDLFKIKGIVKQVKRKTLSFHVDTLNILLNAGYNVDLNKEEDKQIESIIIDTEQGVENSEVINNLYPKLKSNLLKTDDDISFFINVTDGINRKTAKENMKYEKMFSNKKPTATYTLMGINILVYIICLLAATAYNKDFYSALALNGSLVKSGQIYRVITAAFLHQNLFHIFTNMYSLYIIGPQAEKFLGKPKYVAVYLISAITGSLLSCVINNGWSLGASGAIFGVMGILLYFGYHYRLYLKDALLSQIVPVIALNLVIGFMVPRIDMAAHIGGLVGGVFGAMALGADTKENKSDKVNGIICLALLVVGLCYLLFFR